MAICCAQAYALWMSTCPTFTADPPGGLLSEQKGVTRHIPQPELPILEPSKSLAESVPAPVSAAQPPKITADTQIQAIDGMMGKTNDNIDQIMRYLREGRVLSDTAYDELAKRVNELGENYDIAFSADAITPSMAAVALSDGRSARGYVQTKQGTMVVLAIRASTAILAGSVTAEVKKNGTLTGFQVVLDTTNPTSNTNYIEPGTYNYAATDILSAVVTTSAGLSPAPNIDVSLGLVHG